MTHKLQEVCKLNKYIKQANRVYLYAKTRGVHSELYLIENKIKQKKYKGIVVYPTAVMWEPVQRPHHILKAMAKRGYICFFCENNPNEGYVVKEMYENVFLINGEEKLIPLLKEEHVIFLITYFLQYVYCKHYKNKTIWFDLLDRLDFLDLYNSLSKKIYNELIKSAKLVTYSNENLKFYLKKREDIILLPNAANKEDFILNSNYIPKDIKEIKEKNKPIIGYYGAIENWIDFDLINELDKTNKYSIVMIGKKNEKLRFKKFKNVYFLGLKSFEELKYYAKEFSIAMIPFLVNDLTNAVSPVKFYEYSAIGLPIISSKIYEMTKYESKILKIVDKNNIVEMVEILLKTDKEIIKCEAEKIINNNTWENRIEKIEGVLKYE